jgi:hypothetical protein
MQVYLVLPVYTSRPTSLLVLVRATVSFFMLFMLCTIHLYHQYRSGVVVSHPTAKLKYCLPAIQRS